MKAFFCAAIALLFLIACSSEKLTYDFGPQPLLDGEETDVSRESAIRSAGFSSISNGSAGSYMSAQYTELQNALRKTNGIAVTRSGHDIDLIMQSAQIFNGGDIAVKPGFKKVLKRISAVLNKYENTAITLIGHTDTDGWDTFNQSLSGFRAGAIAEELEASDVPPIRIAVEGVGEASPVVSNASFAGRDRNNRMILTISPLTSY